VGDSIHVPTNVLELSITSKHEQKSITGDYDRVVCGPHFLALPGGRASGWGSTQITPRQKREKPLMVEREDRATVEVLVDKTRSQNAYDGQRFS
jgi:hypothetical protein